MKQNIPRSTPGLVGFAAIAVSAASQLGEDIGLFHGSAPKLSADLNALIDARNAYEAGRIDLRDRRQHLQFKTQECRETIRLARDILKQHLGIEYNQRWDRTGMVGSIAVPKSPEELIVLCDGFKAYFDANPAHENPLLQITATQMQLLYTDLIAANNAVLSQALTVSNLLDTRNAKAERLYKRLRICVEELDLLISPTDPRWQAFGFNKPGAQETPDAPQNVEVIVVNETTAMIEFPPVARAGHYRVYKRVVGLDAEPIAIGSPIDPDFTYEELPRNATIEFTASAVNEGGESMRSEAVAVTTT